MKKILCILLVAGISLTSCKSIEKMVEKGQYDEAILFAAEKLQGEKNKKTKYVVALEDAFARVMNQDLAQIERMEKTDRAEYYGHIYNLWRKIERRQARISPFLPLTSENGYTATFSMVDPRDQLEKYASLDAAYHYKKGVALLDKATPENKQSARNAFTAFRNIDQYYQDYKDVEDLKIEARDKGMENILISVTTADHVFLDRNQLNQLAGFKVSELDRNWTTFYTRYIDQVDYDIEVIVRVEDVLFGREQEVVHHFHHDREIQDGYQYVLDDKGNVAKDTLGNDIKEPRMLNIRAVVTEVERNKEANIIASVEIIDLRADRIVDRQQMESPIFFNGFACRFTGDKRALDHRAHGRLDGFLEPFPTDHEMLSRGIVDIHRKAKKKIKRVFS